ncbi:MULTISPECIES: hypothetical protein [Stenotrophomonas]|uniref:hypothetical protein n=1 Tax=Stenotrophomonas sp. CC22-02 TaxID=1378087 RepID=UPI001063BB3B|nr:hypothetical protein [Stenotrophomonas sp. CC22-02]MBN5171512.1 hypothetical protein [Stenotrophomonas maltophilia]HEL3779796.1 hypothetical protein [Stenotrophomonas maltophilia]HEL5003902.1 hypothetical protein [Stenotrophomonas maltophilia]
MSRARLFPLLAGIGIVLVAIMLAALAWRVELMGLPHPQWLSWAQAISAVTRYSQNSQLGLAADVYYALMPLLVPVSAFWSHRALCYDADGRPSAWQRRAFRPAQRRAGVFAVPLFAALPVTLLCLFRGGDLLRLSIQGNFWAMALKGWLPFFVCGVAIALVVSMVEKLLRPASANAGG